VPPAHEVPGRDPAEEARKWKAANPDGWDQLVQFAFNDHRRGRRCSIGFYCELLRRPEYHVNRVDGCPYLVNNTARSGLVRLLIAAHPQLEESFELRLSRADATLKEA